MKRLFKMKSLRSKKGFTLIEIIVVVTAVAVISGVVGVSVKDTNENTILYNAANKALSDLRYAQEVAMTTRREVNFIVNTSTNGYEIRFADTGDYVKDRVFQGQDMVVQLGTGNSSGVSIVSSETTNQLSFTAWGEPYIGGSNFSSERSVAFFNSTIHLIINESGFSYLGEAVGGSGCGFTIC